MNAVERLQIAQVADYCVRWLKTQGLKVQRVEGDTAQPRIIVKYSELCERMGDDIVLAYERSFVGERRYGWVFRFGCQVKWSIPKENPHQVRRAA